MVDRIFVEKQKNYDNDARKLKEELKSVLGIDTSSVRKVLRYDVEGVDKSTLEYAESTIFSEPNVDLLYKNLDLSDKNYIIVEYLDGQYDQRADSAAQCVQLLTSGKRPEVACATIYIFEGLKQADKEKVKKHLINPVDSKEGSIELPKTLFKASNATGNMRIVIDGFIDMDKDALSVYYNDFGFAMTFEDLCFVQSHFIKEQRNPTFTELKVIDTYWSDHCRHTTFLTELKEVVIHKDNAQIAESFAKYREVFDKLYKGRDDKYTSLMDIATIAAKVLKKEGYIDNLDESEEINACSVVVKVDNDGVEEDWLIMFKNETHNHPTEIEPYGGAATCLGGAIRDPLSGRAYVYQAMRITGSGNPLEAYEDTLDGKLPQRMLTRTALAGFSSYGNQIGLATGIVHELYNDRFKAKRLETGYVIGGAPKANVRRISPVAGDVVLLVGGDTGRDGCGGATGSSKAHTVSSVELCGAEVQKGNPPEERKLQRLFKRPEAAQKIIKCNDFGAGGVSVAIGELARGIDIYLERINKKYEGLTATELAISESQERMAIVVKADDADAFIEFAEQENIKAVCVAKITDTDCLRMYYDSELIVDIDRKFLDTNGVKQLVNCEIKYDKNDYFDLIDQKTQQLIDNNDYEKALYHELSKLNNCSQKGAGEVFDSTIGAASVLMPFGGKMQLTPAMIMASKPPVDGFTKTVTCSSFGIYPELMIKSPYIGAIYSIIGAVSKLVASGVRYNSIRLTLQEYFKRLYKEPLRWGEPLAAILGAFDAQISLKLAAIGGKDSMSGTFEDIDVPPTLIAFAMGITHDDTIINNAFGNSGYIYRFCIPKIEDGKPCYENLISLYGEIAELIDKKQVKWAAVEEYGFLVTLAKSLIGNVSGAELIRLDKEMFLPSIGNIIIITANKLETTLGEYLGQLNDSGKITSKSNVIDVDNLIKGFTSTLEPVFRNTAFAEGTAENISYYSDIVFKNSIAAKPKVIIPVFPGTNCEYDTARAFIKAGAKVKDFVIRNNTPNDIEESIKELKHLIDTAEIIAFPGGFSAGDEPDGSGKFIATAFRNPMLSDSVKKLLERGGLALGICNGFQALIKLGLLPYSSIQKQDKDSATLTYNNIARHVSTMCRIRIASNNSPWLSSFNVGDIYSVPVSHGEGRFIATDKDLTNMIKSGQIATQYVDNLDNATMQYPYNPNGSKCAVEGIISPDGRVLGKMGHSERWQKGLYQNVEGNYDMNIFLNGVKYFS